VFGRNLSSNKVIVQSVWSYRVISPSTLRQKGVSHLSVQP
jgi:hypothetical protein